MTKHLRGWSGESERDTCLKGVLSTFLLPAFILEVKVFFFFSLVELIFTRVYRVTKHSQSNS